MASLRRVLAPPLLVLLVLLGCSPSATTCKAQTRQYGLDSLAQGPTGFRIDGPPKTAASPSSLFGPSVALADLNGDGTLDVVVGSMFSHVAPDTGCVYVAFTPPGTAPQPSLSSERLLRGPNTTLIEGSPQGWFGYSVAAVGDVNGDSISDVAIGAPGNHSSRLDGVVYVVYGRRGEWQHVVGIRSLGTEQLPGFAFTTIGETMAGISVAAAGDQNGDGLPDVVVGAPFTYFREQGIEGGLCFLYGKRQRAATVNENDLRDPTEGACIRGLPQARMLGYSVTMGHFNRGGIADIAAGTTGGIALVMYEKGNTSLQDAYTPTYNPISDNGTTLVRSVGDINGDGVDELSIGRYVVLGKDSTRSGVLKLEGMGPTEGFNFSGPGFFKAQTSAAAAGDVNGDRTNDFVLATFPRHAVSLYVIFGKFGQSSWPSMDLDNLECSQGYKLRGERSDADFGVTAGDINGDGLSDVVATISATGEGNHLSGTAYVVYGVGLPTLKKNDFVIAQGQPTIVTREHLDFDSPDEPQSVIVEVSKPTAGFFAFTTATDTQIKQFTLDDLDNRRVAFLSLAPVMLEIVPKEGEPVHVALCNALGDQRLCSALVEMRGKELKAFQRSFPQYYQMHHEDYTEKRIRANKLPIIFVVTAAWEVRNPTLEAWYERRREYMGKELGRTEDEMEERVAFHGTKEGNIGAICDNGLLRVGHPLNPSRSTDAGFFGDPRYGVYASRFVEYALQYSNVATASDGIESPMALSEGDKVRIVMFKVLPGRTMHMESFVGAVGPTAGYDSHSSPQWSEWFFFDETQLCPTHVVEVKAITNARTEANEGL
eukprot:m51a1_g4296 hypothetical protein (824) ;mRNA; r:419047-422247